MTTEYYSTVKIGFVYDGSNGKEISGSWPYNYAVLMGGDLVVYNAGFIPVEVGSVISSEGVIVASSMEEFNAKYSPMNG